MGTGYSKPVKHAEALPLLKSAAELFPEDEYLWQKLVWSASQTGQHFQAIQFAMQGLDHHPRSAWLWGQLGSDLTENESLDEAEKALNNAVIFNPNADWHWRRLAGLHRKRKDPLKEIEALEGLHAVGKANPADLHQLGIAYFSQEKFAKALEYYRLALEGEPDAAIFVNMGLIFSTPEFSQKTDAADAYRRALAIRPDYGRAKEEFEKIKRKLLPLAEHARIAAKELVSSRDQFEYVNPFETLQIENVESVDKLDLKLVNRQKSRLLQEIELNDGKVGWLNDRPLDKSHALSVVDEIDDLAKRRYHWAIFQNKCLLRFLTNGDLQHFLYSDDYFPLQTLELWDEEPEFRSFLSKHFALQYNHLLSRAIDQRLLPVVEILFDGRRWVEPKDDDICFEGTHKRIGDLLNVIRSKANDGRTRKVGLDEMESLLRDHSLPELFNLLTAAFSPAQRAIVAELRSLAITSSNEHGDLDLSKAIINLCKRFTSRSVELANKLDDDLKTVEKMIADERKHSVSVLIRPNELLEIGKAGIAFAGASMQASGIEAIRWGMLVETVNGIETDRTFSLFVRDTRSSISITWGKAGASAGMKGLIPNPGTAVPITQLPSKDQEQYFQQMIDASLFHLSPELISKIIGRLQGGHSVVIGPCTLYRDAIAFRVSGSVVNKEYHLPWQDVETQMQRGHVYVVSRTERESQVSMSAKGVDNAVLLPILGELLAKDGKGTTIAFNRPRCTNSFNPSCLWWAVAIVVIVVVICISNSSDANKNSPTKKSIIQPAVPNSPVSNLRTAEMEREHQMIESEKAEMDQLEMEIKTLSQDIERRRTTLDRTSQVAVDKFNRKVDDYNRLLEQVRIKERQVNQMVESYNEKVRQQRR